MRSVCLKCSVSEDRKMHVLYILILCGLPSLLLAEKCPHDFKNPRTKRLETIWLCCQGFTRGSGGSCDPICNTPCENGKCFQPNECKCDEGYQNPNNDKSRCVHEPKCIGGCGNGTCIAPSVCRCDKGYDNNNITIQCLPVCEAGCKQEDCVAPGKCNKCRQGTKEVECSTDDISNVSQLPNTTPHIIQSSLSSAESISNFWTVGISIVIVCCLRYV